MLKDEQLSPLLSMREVSKSFSGIQALNQVSFDVRPGEVHCLLGQNGAGKSTLIKTLAGVHKPDGGTITWQGSNVDFNSPIDAIDAGIATMYQELDVVDGLTISENIFLGHERSRGGIIQGKKTRDETLRLLGRLGHSELNPDTEVGSLSAANKQIVSMARALSHETKLIIMDEPSAVLDSEEVNNLFQIVRELIKSGLSIIYITHRLEEIREIGDRITVLKDGTTMASGLPVDSTSTSELIQLMTGRTLSDVFPKKTESYLGLEPLLEVSNLSLEGVFEDITFSVRPGEVFGIAGLVGSGRSEILETVYGAHKPTKGSVSINGEQLRPGDVDSAISSGLGLSPEERKSQGLLLDESVAVNISLASISKFSRFGFLKRKNEREVALQQINDFQLRPANPDQAARVLSGGNQQKILLARWLVHGTKVLLLDEPTRGVDVGARAEIYALIRKLAAEGNAVVVVSSELEEVIGLSDTIMVVGDGKSLNITDSKSIDEHQILDLVMKGSAA